jgi:hypothetical protein
MATNKSIGKKEKQREKRITYDMKLSEIKKFTYECSCSKCRNGCLYGSGAMTDNDIKNMARLLNITEQELKDKYLEIVERYSTKRYRPKILRNGKPYGRCIFYDDKIGCKVHNAKPLECSIAMSCSEHGEDLIQWFNAHYFLDLNKKDSIKEWNQMVKLRGTIPGATIQELIPDKNKRKSILEG